MGMGDVKLAFGIGAILPFAYAFSAYTLPFDWWFNFCHTDSDA